MIFSDQLLSHLPAPSRVKIERLDSERDSAHAAVRHTSDAMQEATREHGLAAGRARERLNMHPGYEIMPEGRRETRQQSTERIERERGEFEARMMEPVHRAKRALERASEAHDRAVQHWQSFAYMEPAARWLERVAGSGIGLNHAVSILDKRPKDPAAEVKALRAQLAELDAAWKAAESAPVPAPDYRERALAEINALAEKGALSVDLRNRGPNPLRLAEQFSPVLMTFGSGADAINRLVGNSGAIELMAWLHRDAIIARINELVDAAPTDGALSYEMREQRFKEISAQRLVLEFQEEGTILSAENAGMQIARRRDCDPRAVLEVSDE